jgi:hypothetical protein
VIPALVRGSVCNVILSKLHLRREGSGRSARLAAFVAASEIARSDRFPSQVEPLRGAYLPDLSQGVVDRARLGLALVFIEVRLQLLFGFFAIEQKFGARSESQAAEIAIRDARSRPDKPHDLKISFLHRSTIVSNSLLPRMSSRTAVMWQTKDDANHHFRCDRLAG